MKNDEVFTRTEYIEREAFIAEQRHLYCENCARRKGMKNGKVKFVYAIGEVPCRACDIGDMLDSIEDYPTADVAPVPRWIPVTERCPEKSGDYLVFDDCRNLYVNEWHCLLKKWQYDDSRITHWMPLPEPPKEET